MVIVRIIHQADDEGAVGGDRRMGSGKLTFGSLFAGIGGIDLGLERAGMECAWQVEIDPFCQKVLAKHWPDVRRYEDVREVGAHNLEPVDLIAGGFPCQDLSLAHLEGKGLQGQRSGLWYEYARVIRQLRPEWILVENVPGLLSKDAGWSFGEVLRELAESGYDAEWDSLPASAFCAPHIRDRVFVVAYTKDKSNLQTDTVLGPIREEWHARQNGRCIRWKQMASPDWELPASLTVRTDDGLPGWMDKANRRIGNAVVPQVAEWIGRRIMEVEEARWEAKAILYGIFRDIRLGTVEVPRKDEYGQVYKRGVFIRRES